MSIVIGLKDIKTVLDRFSSKIKSQLDTGLEILQLLSGQKVCPYLGGDKGEGASKIGIFTMKYFLNGPTPNFQKSNVLYSGPLNQHIVFLESLIL